MTRYLPVPHRSTMLIRVGAEEPFELAADTDAVQAPVLGMTPVQEVCAVMFCSVIFLVTSCKVTRYWRISPLASEELIFCKRTQVRSLTLREDHECSLCWNHPTRMQATDSKCFILYLLISTVHFHSVIKNLTPSTLLKNWLTF